MPLVRILCAFGILLSVSMFIASNTERIGAGTGYFFLALAIACFGAMVTLQGDLASFLRIKRSTIFFIIFLAYFGIKQFFESEDSYATRQVLVGTSNGVIFALVLGWMCGHALSTIYELRFRPSVSQLVAVAGLVYAVLVVFLTWGAFQANMGQVRSDLFLVEDTEGLYQRTGALAAMQIMLLVSLVTTLFASFRQIGLFSSAIFLPLVLVTGAFTGLMSQLIGSNSGMVTSAGLVFIFIVNYVVMYSGARSSYQSIELSQVIFGPLGLRILFGTLVAGALILFSAVGAMKVFGIDTSMLRISGFGTGESGSITSRAEIFSDNFLRHLEYSPIFGNTQVDILTTGGGTFVHSLLSILTHLGFVGAALFVTAMFWMYVEIVTPRRTREVSLYASNRYGLFRMMMLTTVLAMCLYSAFFTWMPLWFALGLFGDWHYRR